MAPQYPVSDCSQRMERQSNFELLRIFAMILVTASHWGWAFVSVDYADFTMVNLIFQFFFRGFGQLGVILYIMISGYFLSKSRVKIQSFLRIVLQVVFTSCLLIISNYIITPHIDLSASFIVRYIFLLSDGDFWFVAPYLFMFLLSPFINIVADKLNKKQFLALLAVIGFFVSVIPSVIGEQITDNNVILNIIFFVFIYLIGAFLRRFKAEIKSKNMVLIVCMCLSVLYAVSILIPCLLLKQYTFIIFFQQRSNFVLILFAIFIFLLFERIPIKQNKVINAISASTFGIYLIHENFLTRQRLWKGLFHLDNYINSPWFIPYSLGSFLLVFVICAGIDMVRKYLLEKPFFKLLEKKLGTVFCKINDLFVLNYTAESVEDIEIKHLLTHLFALAIGIILSVIIPFDNLICFLCLSAAYLVIWVLIVMIKTKRKAIT